MERPKVITLDVGNTLLLPYPSLGEIYAGAAARCGLYLEARQAEDRFVHAWRAALAERNGLVYGRTDVEARAFWRRMVAEVVTPLGATPEQTQTLVDVLYTVFSHADAWQLQAGWSKLVSRCRFLGVRLGLVSNWDVRLRGLLDEVGVLAQVDAAIISAECGWEKPDARVFQLALSRLGAAASEAVHVGDSWEEDVEAARAVGMDAVWFNPRGCSSPVTAEDTAEIADLAELIPLLGLGPCSRQDAVHRP